MSDLLMCGDHQDCIVSYLADNEEEEEMQCPLCIIEVRLNGICATIKGIQRMLGVAEFKPEKGKKKRPKSLMSAEEAKEHDEESDDEE